MGELIDYFVQRYSKNTSESEDMMKKTRVKNTLSAMSETLLKPGDTLEFEVLPKDLPYVMLVVDEEPLKSTVTVEQVSESLFQMKLIELVV